VVLDTDLDAGPASRFARLARGGGERRFERAIGGELLGVGLDFDRVLRPQLGNPLALAAGGGEEPVAAVRVREPESLERVVERGIASGRLARVDLEGALGWRQARGPGRVAALAGTELVVAADEDGVRQAIETARGTDSLAYDRALVERLEKLGGDSLVRVAGDAQRLLDSDPQQAAILRRIPWVRALGAFDGTLRPAGGLLRLRIRLATDRVPLTEAQLPLAPGAAAPRLHDPDAPASVAVREPDRLARFAERVAAVTDPDGYESYRAGVSGLRELFGVDLHRDLLAKIESLSIALPPAAVTLQAPLRPGERRDVARALERATPGLEIGLNELLPGTTLDGRESREPRSYELRRGGLRLARFAVRGESLVGSVGLAKLPTPVRGTRPHGAAGSLVLEGDLRRIGSLAGPLLALPEEAVDVLSRLGDVTLAVRAERSGLRGSGRLRVHR
jgi:hypothetical protein